MHVLPVELLPVQDTLVLRARGSELLILPSHVHELKTLAKAKDFSQYFRAEALLNRPARKLFEAWLRKDQTLWTRLYKCVHKEMDLSGGPSDEAPAEAPKPAAKAPKAEAKAKTKSEDASDEKPAKKKAAKKVAKKTASAKKAPAKKTAAKKTATKKAPAKKTTAKKTAKKTATKKTAKKKA
jgi:hypothetical protein